jgi:rhamnosyltransferase
MRSKDDIRIIERTLKALRSQSIECQILNIDSGSTDGTLSVIRRFTDRLIEISPESYIPGAVINRGMAETDGEFVVFLNSDAVPTSRDWLESLLGGFQSEQIGAVFGRQISRPYAHALVQLDTDRAFGDGFVSAKWKHFFSMANSAVRRTAWEHLPFSTSLRYSEDIDWTWRLKQRGVQVAYISEAIAEHSHNYTLHQSYVRQRGEGEADAQIYGKSVPEINLFRSFLLPLSAAWSRDVIYCLKSRRFAPIVHSLFLRPVQHLGRYSGYRKGAQNVGG